MTNSIVQSNSIELSKDFTTDSDGKGFVSRRGLARMCGKQAPTITRLLENIKNSSGTCTSSKSLEMLLGQSFEGVAWLPDHVTAAIVQHYAFSGSIKAQEHLLLFGAIGLRALIQQSTGYKPNLKRKLTAEEIIEICCLPVPTTWERRFPEEYYEHLSRLTGLVVDGHTRPCYWAALTKELIYDYLPEGIYGEIKRCKDESGSWDRLHQYLSGDGVEILQSHQKKVLHHMQGAASVNQLRTALKQACTGQYQLVLL
jgi:hypothetical protein